MKKLYFNKYNWYSLIHRILHSYFNVNQNADFPALFGKFLHNLLQVWFPMSNVRKCHSEIAGRMFQKFTEADILIAPVCGRDQD